MRRSRADPYISRCAGDALLARGGQSVRGPCQGSCRGATDPAAAFRQVPAERGPPRPTLRPPTRRVRSDGDRLPGFARPVVRQRPKEGTRVPIPSFAMHDLGWFAFQQLCHTILREVLGQTVQSFLGSRDGGRDGAFQGTWTPAPGDPLSGAFVVQCKHTARAGANLRLGDLEDELEKAEKLVKAGECRVYMLMTNAGVGGVTEVKIRDAFQARGIKHVLVFGATWMNQTIAENPRLRRLVPRLYGLGDLTQILDERAHRQARAVLDSMRTDLDKLVLTSTYERATAALEQHGFVLLFGAPATGKTTIAAQLALGAADEFDTAVVKLDTAADFQDRWNPDERQLFWLDDAFGATQFDYTLARAWTTALPRIASAIRGGSKVVLTSRDYIFRAARGYLKPGSFPLFEEARVVVDVLDLRPLERRQILYNHLRHGQQPNAWLRDLEPNLEAAASHPEFTPEQARRLSHPHFTEHVRPHDPASVESFFARPGDFLRDVMAGLDADARAALGLIFVHHDWLSSPVVLDERSEDLVSRLGSILGGVVAALDAMEGSLVQHLTREGQTGWVFAHPTMADAYSRLMRSPDLLGHLLTGFPLEVLMREVTCGDLGVQGALVVGPAHYDTVLERLDSPLPSPLQQRWQERSRRTSFLATRCDKAFLTQWCGRNPKVLDELAQPGLMLQAVAANELVARLNEFGLFPEPLRAHFAEQLIEYCLNGTDPAVLWDEALKSVLTAAEWGALLRRVRSELISDLRRAIDTCTDGVDLSDNEPESVIDPIATLALHLPDLFPGDEYVAQRAQELDALVDQWISNQEPFDRPDRHSPRSGAIAETDREWTRGPSRSVFDDLLDGRTDGT